MKECPVCKRTYANETLSFCLEDGTILNEMADQAPTQFIPSPRVTNYQNPAYFSTTPATKSRSKIWLVFPVIGVLAIIVFVGIVGLAVAFRKEIFSGPTSGTNTPVPLATSSRPVFNTPSPPPTPAAITASQLVGNWRANVVENNVSQTITVNLKSDGSYDAVFVTKQGQTGRDYGTWQFSNGTLYQVFSNGASGKGSLRVIDDDTFELTIIDNGVPAYNGTKRVYHRIF